MEGNNADRIAGRYAARGNLRICDSISRSNNARQARRLSGGIHKRTSRSRRTSFLDTWATQRVLRRLGLNCSYSPVRCSVSVLSRPRKSHRAADRLHTKRSVWICINAACATFGSGTAKARVISPRPARTDNSLHACACASGSVAAAYRYPSTLAVRRSARSHQE